MSNFKGVYPPVITIFDQSGNVDNQSVLNHIEHLIEKGVDGVVLFGTTSEFCSVTLDEKKQLLSLVMEKVDARAKVLVGVGDTCVSNTLELICHAENVGADALLAITPYYLVYAEDMVEAYYDKIATSTKLPVILYNFPALTGFSLMHDLVLRLAIRHKNIIGIKDTISDFEHVRSMIKIKKEVEDFIVFCAFESQVFSAFACGSEAIISATGNFAPEVAVNFVKAYSNGDLEEAQKWFQKICIAMDVYHYASPLILPCKEAAYQRFGIENPGERLPALPLPEATKLKIAATLAELEL